MPIYTYQCLTCGKVVEQLKPISKMDCVPICEIEICNLTNEENSGTFLSRGEFKRVWENSAPPQFKGSGFYQTDYKNK
jgi:predicted nucleic acid-binding Zn ribbon protein